jgi:ankyrin repeat protein
MRTPLRVAAQRNDLDIVRILLNHGADVITVGKGVKDLFILADTNKSKKMRALLQEAVEKNNNSAPSK